MAKNSLLRLVPCAAALVCFLAPFPALAQAEPPSNFAAVARHLDPGGVFYTILDLDGDLARFAGVSDALMGLARTELGAAIPPGLSAKGILEGLGLDRVKAVGMSSKKAQDHLFQNRAMIYMPEGRSGLAKLFGGAAAPLQSPRLAPAGSDLVLETELTLSALLEITESVLRSTGDPQILNQYKGLLGFPVPGLEMTAGDFIGKLNTRLMVAGRLEAGKTFTLPGSTTVVPAFRLVVSFDQLDFLFPPLMEYAGQSGRAAVEKGEGFERIVPSPNPPGGASDFQFLIHHDLNSKRILIATHPDALKEFLESQTPLADSEAFRKATAGLPMEGNEFSYVTPAVFKAFDHLLRSALSEAPTPYTGSIRTVMEELGKLSPWPAQPIASVRANLPEGMVFQSTSPHSFKSLIPAAATLPVAILSAASFGAYSKTLEKTRTGPAKPPTPAAEDEASPDEAVESIRNNLQQIAFAAQSYFVDRPEATEVSYDQLIEAELLFRLEAVDGESYKGLKLKKTGGTLSAKRSGGDAVSHKYGPVTD
ncbi:MAG: hypothetical protein V4675_04845 [Verrucomicrobiota bacterium]